MKTSLCRQTGKRRFRTYERAMAQLAECERKRRDLRQTIRMERAVYLCDHCDDWHLTKKRRRMPPDSDMRSWRPREVPTR